MKKMETDVVVIGGGTAGLPAALTASEAGASVILLEKMSTTGGSMNVANMCFAVESRLQKLKPPVLSKEEAFRIHMDWTHWKADSRLVWDYYSRSAGTIEWLEKQGVEFEDIRPYVPGSGMYNTTHIVKAPRLVAPENIKKGVGAGAVMVKTLTDRARERGIQIFLRTSAKKLLKQKGRIVGVVAQTSGKEEIRVKSKSVIIATGGFTNNKAWVKKYCRYEEGKDMWVIPVAGLKGDGLSMAWEAGAGATDIHMGLNHQLVPPYQGPIAQFHAFGQPSNITVNLAGERFIPEDLRGGHSTMANAMSIQPERCAFAIFDGDTYKFYDETLPKSWPKEMVFRPMNFKSNNLEGWMREAMTTGYKYLYITDTLEALCNQTGIDRDGLMRTVAEYNSFCEKGQDSFLNKDPKHLRPVKKPKFYAAKYVLGAYNTVGGIRINSKTEVLDKTNKVIPGLYATGNDANNIYAGTYVPLAGNFVGFAVNTGRMAGENAVEYIKNI